MSQAIMVKNGKRIDWIDIAKGMSIILIVFGHSFLAKIPYIGDWFSSFLIPFFFFMSGLLHKTTIDFQKFIHNRWKGLLRPFFIFSIIVLIGYFGLGFEEGMHRVSTLTYGWGGYALWFIPVLLTTNLLYFLICRLLQSAYSRIMVVSILCIFGYLTYRLSLPNYWNLNFTFTAVFFYGIGNICQPILNKIFSGSLVKCILLTTFSLLLSCLFIFNDKPEFFVNHLGGAF